MTALPALTVRGLAVRTVRVPMRRPLATSRGRIEAAPLVLLDLETAEGVTGRSYLFAYLDAGARALRRLLAEMGEWVRGQPAAPLALSRLLAARLTLIGREGLAGMAAAGLDVACWDALARAAGLPLARLLGGTLRPVPAYNSTGLSLADPQAPAAEAAAALADEAVALLAEGFPAVKLRLGYATAAADLAAVRAVRARIPASALLMVDYNQALTPAEAIRRGRLLDGEGVYWIEEPVRHDDFAGAAEVAREVATPVQLGENFAGPAAMAAALAARACDYVMPDLARIGGVTGWLAAAALAAAAGRELSSHLFPEVSAQLLAVTPTAHWLEYVDWAAPVLLEPLRIVEGAARPTEAPGVGLAWDEAAVARYAFD
ncbi:MAG TPA: enolase C-terminal domain-like protein [Thermodesulfobacteriota bacterium]|nr:enolase C-terminal domain-like protein [Thermodesulfobacteriota bacterium]